MTIEDAQRICSQNERLYGNETELWREALDIFVKYCPTFTLKDLKPAHDEIFFPGFDERITEEEVLLLHRCGLGVDIDNDCWYMFT